MKKLLLAATLAFMLACAGITNALSPELPFTLPPDTSTDTLLFANEDGVSTTTMGFTNATADPVALQADIERELTEDGWTVLAMGNLINGTKDGGKSVTVTVRKGDAGGAEIDLVLVD